MARPRITADLHLFMNGQRVGSLTRTAVGQLRFEYGGEWLQSELSRPLSLSLPLSQRVYTGDVVENFFENLLLGNVAEKVARKSKIPVIIARKRSPLMKRVLKKSMLELPQPYTENPKKGMFSPNPQAKAARAKTLLVY